MMEPAAAARAGLIRASIVVGMDVGVTTIIGRIWSH
jgi:hypothetical protein